VAFVAGESDDGSADYPNEDEIASRAAKTLALAPEIATAWKCLTELQTPAHEAATVEIVRLFKVWLASLPLLQRKVAEVMAIRFGNVTDEEIRQRIGRNGVLPPLGSVKSARREIREKFKSLINQMERTKNT
jgi:hypothetical protein